ncbi:hypothetical protein BU17DRAFT_96709 [Hysterangium stoloniferum]|nr:hypothetical protein BU17DRAFT_96709 [Hysterangium stoloniferum]
MLCHDSDSAPFRPVPNTNLVFTIPVLCFARLVSLLLDSSEPTGSGASISLDYLDSRLSTHDLRLTTHEPPPGLPGIPSYRISRGFLRKPGLSVYPNKNKVYSLLKAVETRGVSTWNSLACDANLFTAISGRLDSVAALKKLAEETRESDREKVKLAAEAQKTAGLNLRDAMMKGHSHRSLKKRTQDDLFLATGHSDIAQEDSSGSGISILIHTSVDAREVMITREEVCAAREEVCAAREEAHAAREEAHAAREEAHAAREEAHAAREEAHAAREEAHAAQEEAHAAQEEAHAAQEEAHAAQEEAHAAQEEARAAQEEARAAQEEARAAQEEARAAQEEAHAAQEEARAAQEEACAAREEAHAAREEAHAAGEEAHAAGEEAHAAGEEAHAAREEAYAA